MGSWRTKVIRIENVFSAVGAWAWAAENCFMEMNEKTGSGEYTKALGYGVIFE